MENQHSIRIALMIEKRDLAAAVDMARRQLFHLLEQRGDQVFRQFLAIFSYNPSYQSDFLCRRAGASQGRGSGFGAGDYSEMHRLISPGKA